MGTERRGRAHVDRAWLDGVEVPEPSLRALIRRYLAAFGPASVQDMQKWSGLSRLRPAFEDARSELVSFADAVTGRELFDLPDAPRPPGDTPVPPRLVGPFDNLILSHADATRVLPAEHRRLVMTQNGLIAGMVADRRLRRRQLADQGHQEARAADDHLVQRQGLQEG